jgi:hypothetical protein
MNPKFTVEASSDLNRAFGLSKEIEKTFKSMTDRMSRSVALLRAWQRIGEQGYFIGLTGAERAVVKGLLAMTGDVLEEWRAKK